MKGGNGGAGGAPARRGDDGLARPDYQLQKHLKKGINCMADDRLDEAVAHFERALAVEPDSVEALLKLGYARFHMDDHAEAMRVYDRVLDIDVANAEAWNLKSLIHYGQKNYARALDSVEKAVDSDPKFGMARYNKACYLSLLGRVPEAIEALKRSIEIDVKNARRAVKDRDFRNVRIEDGFKRIIEVVVLESVRQGYHTIGAIVWTTFLDRADAEEALRSLMQKGLITVHERRDGFHKIPTYDLAETVAKRLPPVKRGLFGVRKSQARGVGGLKRLSSAIQDVKVSIGEENVGATLENFEQFIDPKKCGEHMIENFLEEHREIRLWKVRLSDGSGDFLRDNKKKMITLFENIEASVTKDLRGAA
ncbi:MAG: tetratricopeptide repeat protein [Thaumarchaeota archaeon]|nr:tetratricopeptide repeat protein [Nitrososphaerota archaeon]MDD9812805.1 tetratricopeptide repeat protein [Nitrososphaerota archaeon]MDD9826079.1 tetratricopeptide repeat protein [Nitrososphaerota archaeon]MDD9843088.1 tetratricopeptide repeat protein [Nitrososphaerota archaeon]RNJ75870.1 MAG: hypothetical protein EB824_01185 [Thaumarchaeota archaeon S15]